MIGWSPLTWLRLLLITVVFPSLQTLEQEGWKRSPDDYISFVGLLTDPRYCGISYQEKEEVCVLLRQLVLHIQRGRNC
ncbi:uncharacterized protein LOC102614097 isoform X4 [Citrus sinensis]|uniref:uncharacterized protein LOC102614097 isoform X4 n=1 Tax=Citrus sinensis TaxID=2711 RepID=UPI002278850B|nr:uncharacterized protein LOC102614097 isoform X4 [Citrus sinensis]